MRTNLKFSTDILRYVKVIFAVIMLGGIAAFLIIDTSDERQRLLSLIGLLFIVAFGYVFSNAPTKV